MSGSVLLAGVLTAVATAAPPAPDTPPTSPASGESVEGTTDPAATPGPRKGGPSDAAIERQSTVPKGEPEKDRFGRPGSPQRFALEIKLGPYLPNVDRRYDGPGYGPYATLFGETDGEGVVNDDPKNAVMPAVAFDWQFFYLGGPIGVGVQAAFFRDKASAIITNPGPDDDSTRSQADSVTFATVPLAALLSYRFSLLADRANVPLVPYVKAGVGYAFWWTRDGKGDIATDADGDRGRGGVWGFQGNAGLMLQLDFIERGTAKKLDQTTGINHTYVFGEFQFSQLDNFGVGSAISLGDATWFAGLAIEF